MPVLRERDDPVAGANHVDVKAQRETASLIAPDGFRESGGGEVEGVLGGSQETGI